MNQLSVGIGLAIYFAGIALGIYLGYDIRTWVDETEDES